MTAILNRYATPLIAGFFAVSLISGVALFFHWGSSYFHSMHEWLSMVLILPFALHIWKNWRPMSRLVTGAPFAIASALALVAALAFVLPSGQGTARGGRPPQFALAEKVMAGSVTEMAAVLDLSPEALSARLARAGFTVAGPDQSLTAVATASGKSTAALASALTAAD